MAHARLRRLSAIDTYSATKACAEKSLPATLVVWMPILIYFGAKIPSVQAILHRLVSHFWRSPYSKVWPCCCRGNMRTSLARIIGWSEPLLQADLLWLPMTQAWCVNCTNAGPIGSRHSLCHTCAADAALPQKHWLHMHAGLCCQVQHVNHCQSAVNRGESGHKQIVAWTCIQICSPKAASPWKFAWLFLDYSINRCSYGSTML